MQKKTVTVLAIGFGGFTVILVIGVIAIVYLVPSVIEWAGNQIDLEKQRRALAERWQAPEDDASPETFFPATVSGYRLVKHDTEAAIPVLRFDIPGWHARYRSGDSRIDVFVYQVTELEREALFGRIEDTFDDDDDTFDNDVLDGEARRSGILVQAGYRCYCSSTVHDQNHLWWMKGWLLVFRTEDSEDREDFVRTFLETTSQQQQLPAPAS
jgi:hypothetical protein